MIDRRIFLGAAALAGLSPAIAKAADSGDAEGDRRLRNDWPWLERYAGDNQQRISSGTRTDIVFMGDSITEGWGDKRPSFFTPGRANRGISGQTTPQMLLRMMADVVALRPRYVHLMAGTNDIAGNTGPMTVEQTTQNLTAMCQLARANGISILLASVPPASRYPWRPGLETIQPIRTVNAWISGAVKQFDARHIDYWHVLANASGGMKPGMAFDDVHPTEQGYEAMESMLSPVLAQLGV